ncbi:acyltransferase family protein [Parablastomonas sp. CN1-191]|uniref:acyltransferase family protein n=1 Tax=Parablastomonas sp. CN1-191 TaxID=3400908 RepID=UPI003BF792A4
MALDVASPAAAAALPRQLGALTGVRGVAAWLVVLFHARPWTEGLLHPAVLHVFSFGYLAVDLFFMLSGFVIWHNYAARLADGGPGAMRSFLWRRFARVWPLHGAMIAAFAVFAAVMGLLGADLSRFPPGHLPYHILLIQAWGFIDPLKWNDPSWSISTEVAAYLLFPALVVLLGRRWVALGGWLLLVAGVLAAVHALFAAHGYVSLGADIARFGLWRCLAEFAVGALVCVGWSRRPDLPAVVPVAVLAAVLAAGWAWQLPETAIAPPAFAATLYALALLRGLPARIFDTRPLRYLGEISYSTYLSHSFIGAVAAALAGGAVLGAGGLMAYFAAVLAASVLLYHRLEKPAQRWLQAHTPGWIEPHRTIPAG